MLDEVDHWPNAVEHLLCPDDVSKWEPGDITLNSTTSDRTSIHLQELYPLVSVNVSSQTCRLEKKDCSSQIKNVTWKWTVFAPI